MACIFLIPSIVGYVLLWKISTRGRSALLAGLYCVRLRSSDTPLPRRCLFLSRNGEKVRRQRWLTPLQSVTFYGAYIQSVSLVSSNIAGHTKKTTVNAIIGTLAYVGSIAGPFAFKGEEAPRAYPTGMAVVLSMLVVVFVCFILLM